MSKSIEHKKKLFFLNWQQHFFSSKINWKFLAAYKRADGKKIDNRRVVVDIERGRTIEGWKPRRLGGGKGGTRRTAALNGVEQVVEPEEFDTTTTTTTTSSKLTRERDRKSSRDRDRDRERKRSRDKRSRSRSRDKKRRSRSKGK
jgi:U1 small nuclear ribonucleoprotein